MNQLIILISLYLLIPLNPFSASNQSHNTLSEKEKKEGWTLLWDGKSFDGWRGIYRDQPPEFGWKIEDGELICLGDELSDSLRGFDIVTEKKYGSFELKFEFKILKNANNGIKYFVDESLKSSDYHGLGLEYAILDNDNWPYDKPDYKRTCGSLYDMVRAPDNAIVKPYGEWNQAAIKVDGKHIRHWLNGVKTVDIIKDSPEYFQLLKKSKYANIDGWGNFEKGHILIQYEGTKASFRNLKIKL
jgi:hypothetical protein